MTATNFPEFNAAVTELTTKVSTLLGDVATMQSVANVQVAVDKAAAASQSATDAAASAGSAATSATSATTSKNAAATSATKAEQWAENAENVTVETGKYSAKHHAIKSATSATSASASAATATTKASEASTSATKASQWAEEAENTAVETGKYSAKHHALKAAASATSASSSASTATTKASEAATSATNAANSAATATTKASEASTSATNAAASETAALAAKSDAEAARDRAETAAATVTGNLIEMGGVSLAAGVYPAKPANNGAFWKVTTGGTVDGVEYGVGDTLVYSKSLDQFYKIDNTESVTSVNGKTGVVSLTAADVGAVSTTGNAATATKLQTARTINGVAFDGTTNITVADATKLPLAGGNMTGDLVYQNVGVGGWARGLTARVQSSGAYAAGIGFLGSGDSFSTAYLAVGSSPWASGNGVRVTAAGVTISGATTFDTLITGSVNGNAATATKLATARTLSLAGDVTGSATFDGSANASITATVANDSHSHSTSTITGLGTAATKNTQTSSADTTAGALMAVGAFGLGGNAVLIGDPDTVYRPSGIYDVADDVTWPNRPMAGWTRLLHISHNNTYGYATQYATAAFNISGNRHFYRVVANGVWTPWVELFHTGNILGTVSQSGGVPTGAIIERGSNANGEYVRFADGTQECFISGFSFPLVATANVEAVGSWTYPAPFAGNPPVVNAAIQNVTNTHTYTVSKLASNSVYTLTADVRLIASASQTYRIGLTALGRWYV